MKRVAFKTPVGRSRCSSSLQETSIYLSSASIIFAKGGKRAKDNLAIQSKTTGFGKNKIGVWYLPDAKNRVDDFIYGLRKSAQNDDENGNFEPPQNIGENPNKSNESNKVHPQNTGLNGLIVNLLEDETSPTKQELDESWDRFRAEEI